LLQNKKIILGVTGGIAAYKSLSLVRLLVKNGNEVKVILTHSAKAFVTPLSFSTLSKNLVLSDNFDSQTGAWHNHVELGAWADLMIIAPASANSLAKMASGMSDNLLLTTYLSAKCPVFVAPAMDLDMYAHPATQENIKKLAQHGVQIIPATEGELASGLWGQGRMAEPEDIISFVENAQKPKTQKFIGKKVLITAGPTQEPLDPVRYITNYSSGKMAYSIADVFAKEGAEVMLISGPVQIETPSHTKRINIVTAKEMYEKVVQHFHSADIIICAAAVSDYRPESYVDNKIKKSDSIFKLNLVKNPDIAKELGQIKEKDQILVGFALETENYLENAKKKLLEKNFDLIVLNKGNQANVGMMSDTNEVDLIFKNGKIINIGLKDKKLIAQDLADAIYEIEMA
jgi:phosphopantothenoylcysteine decarboxylase / phosphopantothenate---cysteine ligase